MADKSVVKNGVLTVPLFHGTSSRFYESIVEFGLGGRNVLEDMGIRAAARPLLEFTAVFAGQDEWLLDIDACQRIAADYAPRAQASMMSFRYGPTYLRPSRTTAARYSRSSRELQRSALHTDRG